MKYLIDHRVSERGRRVRLGLWTFVLVANLIFWFLLLAYPTILVIGLGS